MTEENRASEPLAADNLEAGGEALTEEELRRQLEEEKQRADGFLANWQRAQADFTNLKRRSEQERLDYLKLANRDLIERDLLPVLDDLERAIESLPADQAKAPWIEGFRLIYRKLRGGLESRGLSEIPALGQPFDPNQHEAVLYAEGPENQVVGVMRKGYRLHDVVIRPAMVTVGKGETSNEQ